MNRAARRAHAASLRAPVARLALLQGGRCAACGERLCPAHRALVVDAEDRPVVVLCVPCAGAA